MKALNLRKNSVHEINHALKWLKEKKKKTINKENTMGKLKWLHISLGLHSKWMNAIEKNRSLNEL